MTTDFPPNVYRVAQRLEIVGHRDTENTEPLIPLCAPCLCGPSNSHRDTENTERLISPCALCLCG